jgi:peptidyl-prolyl cis-trans isomerase B (cyclophilin B)
MKRNTPTPTAAMLIAVTLVALMMSASTAAVHADHHGPLVHVKMSTTVGDYLLELDKEKAPISVENFLAYVNDGFYTGTIFHRVVPNFVVQGGGFDENWTQKETMDPIHNEAENELKNDYGTIAMARTSDPHSATSQFYINTKNNDMLNHPRGDGWGYCVFGKVIAGIDAVEIIHKRPVQKDQENGAVVITGAEVVSADMLDAAKTDIETRNANAAKAEAQRAKNAMAKLEEKLGSDFETAKALIASKGVDIAKGVKTDSGLWYVEVTEGEGDLPTKNDKVMTHYTGWNPDGSKFDSSHDRGTPFPVSLTGGVIPAWIETVAMMKQGGKRYIIAPPKLAYGERGHPPVIPPNATLVFQIEVVEIQRN